MTINCKGNLIDLSTPKVMGILNLTPDSFFDGGKYKNEKSILLRVEQMLTEGATFIDIGAYSSRPGAIHISEEEEISRIVKIIILIIKKFPESILSIDTFRSRVALECLEEGATIINDITSGEYDEKILSVAFKYNAPYIMMHMKGMPYNMQSKNDYNNLIKEIIFYFSKKIQLAKKYQLNDIIIDPGFGFSKNIEQNFELLKNLNVFKNINLPILVGLSRKSMIYKLLNTSPNEALNGTSVLNTIALSNGASILRVHDIKEAIECIKIMNEFNKQ